MNVILDITGNRPSASWQHSLHPAQLLGIKQRVLTSNLPEIALLVQKILRADDPMKIRDLLDKLNTA